MNDPNGYDRLARSLDFLVIELSDAGLDAQGLARARRFCGGSPTEFLHEAELALQATLADGERMAPSVAEFIRSLLSEIRLAFDRIGGA